MKKLFLIAAMAAAVGLSSTGTAQVYPARAITMVVPFAAGGATDVIGRTIGERMRASLGSPVVIENVTGAGGTIGVGRAARAAPDGYTLSIGQNGSHVMTGATYTPPYDLRNAFEPVALLSTAPFLLAARKTMAADDVAGVITWLKANPDKATLATGANGGPGHVASALLQRVTGTRFQYVPYRGAALALQDLVAGNIDLMITDPASSVSQLRAGLIKVYAVAAKTRLPSAPDIPTVDEAGLPGFYVSLWHGLWAPKGTPKDIVAKLNVAIVDALADADVRFRLAELGQEIFPRDLQTPEALAAYHKAEIEKWWPIVKAANIKAE